MSGPDDDAAAGADSGGRPDDDRETSEPHREPGTGSRLVTEGDLRSGSVSLLLLAAVVWLNDLPLEPAAAAAGVPAGPVYAYVENRLLAGPAQRVVLLLAVVGALAAVGVVVGLAPAVWLALGATAGMQALGYVERWREA